MICEKCQNNGLRGLPYLIVRSDSTAPEITPVLYKRLADLPKRLERIRNNEICAICEKEATDNEQTAIRGR